VTVDIARYSGDPDAQGGVRLVELTEGAGRGIRLLEFHTTAGLRFDVLVDRGMDIGRVEYRNQNVSWNSATGYRHPAYWNAAEENGISLMRGMSGLLVTGGLDHIFSASEADGRRFGYPARNQLHHPLHGRISNTPAHHVNYGRDGAIIWAEAAMRQVAEFGENLELRRRIEIDQDGSEIRLTDLVTNRGFTPTAHYMLYHTNLGWPLLSEDARFSADILDYPWMTSNMQASDALTTFPPPQDDFVEQCAQVQLKPDDAGWMHVGLDNPPARRGFSLAWDSTTLPSLVQWINARSGSYAVALEPCSHGTKEMREGSGLPHDLAPGDSRRYQLVFAFNAY